MSLARIAAVVGALSATWILSACMEQYDPSAHHKRFQTEYDNSVRPVATVASTAATPVVAATPTPTADSSVTPAAATAAAGDDLTAIKAKYTALCASCHGATGAGDGAPLNPKPRDFTDATWQGKADDALITAVIKNGGAANGLSALMPPWGASLSDAEIASMVKVIRGFKK